MHRNLKAIGLTLIAALAVCAFAVSAQADPDEPGVFTAGETNGKPEHTTSILHGTQYGGEEENYFEIGAEAEEAARTTCTNSGVSFTSTVEEVHNPGTKDEEVTEGTAKTLTVEPTYKECTALGGLPAIVKMNGCDYTFTQPHTIEGGKYTGDADLYCPTGQSIIVTVYLEGTLHTEHGYAIPLCTIQVSPKSGTEQTLGGHVVYTNNKDGAELTEDEFYDDVTVDATATEIHWSKSGLCGENEGDDGVYNSTVTVTGTDGEGNHHDVWISDETTP